MPSLEKLPHIFVDKCPTVSILPKTLFIRTKVHNATHEINFNKLGA